MESNKVFYFFFLLSLAVHSVFFLHLPFARMNLKHNGPSKIQVTYIQQDIKQLMEKSRPILKERQDMRLPRGTISFNKETTPTQGDADIFRNKETTSINKPSLAKTAIALENAKISIESNLKLDKAKSQVYLNYRDLLTEKIKHSIRLLYNHSEVGTVRVSFVIYTDGRLKAVKINDMVSSPSAYLKDITRRGISDTVPFPQFPKDLQYPEMSFSVNINFKNE